MSRVMKMSGTGAIMSLAGIDFQHTSEEEMLALVEHVLAERIHGISFSAYLDGQGPRTELSEVQVRERLAIIQPYISWVRSFSCTEGNQFIPGIARESGLKTLVGIWLDDNLENNEREIANAIEVAREGHANILAVGNEVLLRDELEEDQLLDYIHRVKRAVPEVQVGYVDAYFKFVDHPRVTDACDVLLANCYPFWEGCSVDYALLYLKDMYRRVVQVANGRRVIISETGWPDTGSATGAALPSRTNAMRYFLNVYQWAAEDGIDIFYFSSFDESWKVGDEGDVGARWGLWDKTGHLKYGKATHQ